MTTPIRCTDPENAETWLDYCDDEEDCDYCHPKCHYCGYFTTIDGSCLNEGIGDFDCPTAQQWAQYISVHALTQGPPGFAEAFREIAQSLMDNAAIITKRPRY